MEPKKPVEKVRRGGVCKPSQKSEESKKVKPQVQWTRGVGGEKKVKILSATKRKKFAV